MTGVQTCALPIWHYDLDHVHGEVVVDLSRDDFPVNVVKVVVPGLEGYMFDFYQPGPRALAFARSEIQR